MPADSACHRRSRSLGKNTAICIRTLLYIGVVVEQLGHIAKRIEILRADCCQVAGYRVKQLELLIQCLLAWRHVVEINREVSFHRRRKLMDQMHFSLATIGRSELHRLYAAMGLVGG